MNQNACEFNHTVGNGGQVSRPNSCHKKKGDSQMSPFSYNLTKAGSPGYRNFIPVSRISFRNSGVNFSSMPSPIITVGPCKLMVYSISLKPAEFSSLLALLMISCLFIYLNDLVTTYCSPGIFIKVKVTGCSFWTIASLWVR